MKMAEKDILKAIDDLIEQGENLVRCRIVEPSDSKPLNTYYQPDQILADRLLGLVAKFRDVWLDEYDELYATFCYSHWN